MANVRCNCPSEEASGSQRGQTTVWCSRVTGSKMKSRGFSTHLFIPAPYCICDQHGKLNLSQMSVNECPVLFDVWATEIIFLINTFQCFCDHFAHRKHFVHAVFQKNVCHGYTIVFVFGLKYIFQISKKASFIYWVFIFSRVIMLYVLIFSEAAKYVKLSFE